MLKAPPQHFPHLILPFWRSCCSFLQKKIPLHDYQLPDGKLEKEEKERYYTFEMIKLLCKCATKFQERKQKQATKTNKSIVRDRILMI